MINICSAVPSLVLVSPMEAGLPSLSTLYEEQVQKYNYFLNTVKQCFMLPTMQILQNILELGPRLFVTSEARGLSQVMQITGATTNTIVCRNASNAITPSSSRYFNSSTIGGVISILFTCAKYIIIHVHVCMWVSHTFAVPRLICVISCTLLELQMRWMFCRCWLSLLGRPASLRHQLSNLFHCFDLFQLVSSV